ncbi:fructokinase [Pseudarthrobacter oxydans]|uniref:Fructokinase n=1 Tax=Pseudarthrobacter oxydans TaxID=1671 RepID=A0AAW8N8W6_PSEOX|nr:carbohydrate kinase [Pseudarthrobacter oxydans]MDR6792013.1 fructokinase [Pseudarthrobacter oxydans]MDR7163431.1 fructokinase [Pseudarthrobacter oxydans]
MDNNGKPHPPGQVPDVVVIGEALIDVVTTPDGTTEHPGGSPANVAYGLARLGVSTGLLTSIGADRRGEALEEHLTGAGVAILPGSRSQERTSTATATIASDGSASYAFDIAWDVEPPDLAHTPPRIVHTGSIASFLSPGAVGVKAMLEELRSECIITYDPNIRPALLGTHAEALHTFEELVQLTSVVKLSDEDAEWLYPRKALEETATHILDLGAELAVITRGSAGSLLASSATTLSIPAVKTRVVDTIGAGDSYMSALILGLLTRGTGGLAPSVLDQLGCTAAAAAAITVSRAGARPPTEDELRTQLQYQPQLNSHA